MDTFSPDFPKGLVGTVLRALFAFSNLLSGRAIAPVAANIELMPATLPVLMNSLRDNILLLPAIYFCLHAIKMQAANAGVKTN
jgi:hypothetical protein